MPPHQLPHSHLCARGSDYATHTHLLAFIIIKITPENVRYHETYTFTHPLFFLYFIIVTVLATSTTPIRAYINTYNVYYTYYITDIK